MLLLFRRVVLLIKSSSKVHLIFNASAFCSCTTMHKIIKQNISSLLILIIATFKTLEFSGIFKNSIQHSSKKKLLTIYTTLNGNIPTSSVDLNNKFFKSFEVFIHFHNDITSYSETKFVCVNSSIAPHQFIYHRASELH